MIVVEGLDNTGKTTLVEQLKEDFPALKHYPSIGNKHDLQQIKDQAIGGLAEDEFNPFVLWDRSRFISEYVYNPVLRNRPFAFPVYEWLDMLASYVSRKQLLIWCWRPLGELKRTFNEREQLDGVAARLSSLEGAYISVMEFIRYLFEVEDNGSRLVTYDYTRDKYQNLKSDVDLYLKSVSLIHKERA